MSETLLEMNPVILHDQNFSVEERFLSSFLDLGLRRAAFQRLEDFGP